MGLASLPMVVLAVGEPAANAATGASSIFMQAILPIAFFAIFYFMILRPQNRRVKAHQQMVNAVKAGNEVVFAGGLMGRITKVQGDYAVIAINDGQELMVQRASIVSVLPDGTLNSLKG